MLSLFLGCLGLSFDFRNEQDFKICIILNVFNLYLNPAITHLDSNFPVF